MQWNFKSRLLYLSTILLAITTSSVSADPDKTVLESLSFNPYAGVEYQYQHFKGNTDWRKFMPANFQNGAVFIGEKYHENFGLEIGYYHSLKTSTNSSFLTAFDGKTASGGSSIIAKVRNKGFSFEWDVYYPLDDHFNVMAILGFVTVHQRIDIATTGTSNLGSALRTVKGKNKTLFRPGLGIEYIEKHWGARAKVLLDDTQKLYVNIDRAHAAFNSIGERAYKQGFTVALGIFYTI